MKKSAESMIVDIMQFTILLSPIILMLTAAAPASNPAALKFLDCDFEGRSMTFGYSEKPTRIIDARLPNVTFTDEKITDTYLSFSVANVFYATDYLNRWKIESPENKAFRLEGAINRVTGEAAIFFYAEHTETSIASCRKENDGPWCGYPKMIGSKVGVCRAVGRKF